MSGGTLPWLKTSKNKIVTEDGQEVILRGANIMGAEWDWKYGDKSLSWEKKAIPEFALNWHGNVLVRGFASDPVKRSDADYLKGLDSLASIANANRMYLVLAWRSKSIEGAQPLMPDDDAMAALNKLAARYKGQSHVVYALQVEPHDTVWSKLRPCFEEMVDSIRLGAGPAHEPLVMIPGANWSRDLSNAIADPVKRANVVYKTHPYGTGAFPTCNASGQFQNWFGQVYDAGLPVFAGEFGLVKIDNACMTMDEVNDFLAFTRERGIGWAAWILDYRATPLMKGENDLSPTDPYGKAVKEEMGKATIDDSAQGAGVNQWQYQGRWTNLTDFLEAPVKYYKNSQSWTDTPNSKAAITFTGQQIRYFGVVAPWHGIAAVSIDGGTETSVDLYASTKAGNKLLWTSPALSPGTHTFTLRASGGKNPVSAGTVIALDRVDITLTI